MQIYLKLFLIVCSCFSSKSYQNPQITDCEAVGYKLIDSLLLQKTFDNSQWIYVYSFNKDTCLSIQNSSGMPLSLSYSRDYTLTNSSRISEMRARTPIDGVSSSHYPKLLSGNSFPVCFVKPSKTKASYEKVRVIHYDSERTKLLMKSYYYVIEHLTKDTLITSDDIVRDIDGEVLIRLNHVYLKSR